ncbi:hypothetical protein K438DRAFT_1779532 [Mycena galopus ATCC 62051]|nr:hypothetical protein K438DRAFT_1779532 [Mycena galopus ATCC 62051]
METSAAVPGSTVHADSCVLEDAQWEMSWSYFSWVSAGKQGPAPCGVFRPVLRQAFDRDNVESDIEQQATEAYLDCYIRQHLVPSGQARRAVDLESKDPGRLGNTGRQWLRKEVGRPENNNRQSEMKDCFISRR